MVTYYVDYANGNDANNGLGPDASHASDKPWKTIGKALGASGISSGDTVYLSPAGAFREVVTVAMTSATVETKVIGDVGNSQGFKTSGGATVAPGPVVWTAYTTNDKTTATDTTVLNLAGRSYLSFSHVMFVARNSALTSSDGTHNSFTDCSFISSTNPNPSLVQVVATFGTVLDWTFDRCLFSANSNTNAGSLYVICTTGVGSDYDINIVVKNSTLFSFSAAATIRIVNSGTSANKGNGVKVKNCSFFGGSALVTANANLSTTYPSTIDNSIIYTGNTTALQATSAGQITESYNLIYAQTPRSNVTAGTGSVSNGSYAALFHFGQERTWGGLLRPFAEPMPGSPWLGFGNDGTQTSYDGFNRPRPAGGASASPAVGAFERSNTFVADSSPIGAGDSAIKCTGPAYNEFLIPVPDRAITVSCSVKWDATYAGTKPQLQLLANDRIGVAPETVTATGLSGSVETLTLSAFTPSANGDYVKVRVLSNDTNGSGVVQVDDFTVTG